MKTYLETMTEHYIIAALWSCSMDNEESFDTVYSPHQIDPTSKTRCTEACDEFQALAGELLNNWTPEQAGHDFWLSRNGHGAGFFDRSEIAKKETCEALQDICRRFGERYCYSIDETTFGIE